jgi:hypothetical protein
MSESKHIALGQKAHCRFGDKGDTGLFVVVAYDAHDFPAIASAVTPERVGAHLGHVPLEHIRCLACPQLGAMVIAVRQSLGGGVTASLALDGHGKTLSGYLLGMTVPWPTA